MYIEKRVIEKTSLSGLRILVIESKRDERDLLAYILESHGATVISEASVVNVASSFVYHPPDVVFASVKAMYDFALASQFQKCAMKAEKQTLIIAVAESNRSAYPTIAQDLGCDACISKPLDITQVVDVVSTLAVRDEQRNYSWMSA